MATKKQNRRSNVRRARRAYNSTVGEIKGTRNGILNSGYGSGVSARHLRTKEYNMSRAERCVREEDEEDISPEGLVND